MEKGRALVISMRQAIVYMLRFYRNYLSKLKLRTCRFHPSCSQYAMDAIEKYGVFSGVLKSLKRIFRCNPFSSGGYDPA